MTGNPQNPRGETLSLWEKLTLTVYKDGKKSEFLTRVEDIKRDLYVLELPIRHSGESHLKKGDAVEVTYSRADAVYSFKASILDLFEGESRSASITKGSKLSRIQRRQYVRLAISGKITYRTLDDCDKNGGPGPEVAGTLLNISAGGVLFESPSKIRHNGIVALSLALKGRNSIQNILAVIKRCEGSRSKGYLIGAEFLTKHNLKDYHLEKIEEFMPAGCGTFDENLQKLIVRFIYDQQVDLRKKGLLNK